MSAAFDHRLIRLLVVDKHFFVRLGLADALNAEPDICVVAETDNAAGAIRLFGELRPDVVLLDGQLADSMGTETLATLRQEFPEARVLLLSINDGPKEAGSALASGASGYLTKNASLAQLVQAIRAIHAGQRYVPPELARRLPLRLEGFAISQKNVESG